VIGVSFDLMGDRKQYRYYYVLCCFFTMATRVHESAHIKAPLDKVWTLLRPLDFKYFPGVAHVELEGKASPAEVGGIRKVTYNDHKEAKERTVQHIKLIELSDAASPHLSWDLVDSVPATHVMSASHTVQLRRVTEDNTTFVEWITDFSKDATQEVIQDAKHKQLEHFKAIAAALAKTGSKDEKKEAPAKK